VVSGSVSIRSTTASAGGSAIGSVIASALALGLCACSSSPRPPEPEAVERPSEAPCAWFGDVRGGVLYFGESVFWSRHRAARDDLGAFLGAAAHERRVGRFDLERETLLPPLDAGPSAPGSGTWDVLAHPNGRVYFTDLFGLSGWVDPSTGRRAAFRAAGVGLNELARLQDGRLLATRYGAVDGGAGSIVVLAPDGTVLAEHPLEGVPDGSAANAAGLAARPAPKSLAYDPLRGHVWVNTDLVDAEGRAGGHDARVLELATGRWLLRLDRPELHFALFDAEGRGHFAWRDGPRLVLRSSEPGTAGERSEPPGPSTGREVLLDPAFPAELDFVQELRTDAEGGVVATRWSGIVHFVSPAGEVRTARLPRPDAHGLYYTSVATDGRLCATYCASSPAVVCAPQP
jgi:hypothetical protein